MEFARRGPATAAADGDVSDGRRRSRDPPSQGYSTLVIRDALQAQLQKDRLRQEIIEAELAKIDRALNRISLADVQQGKPVPYSCAKEEFMPHLGSSGGVKDPKEKDGRTGELKPWKPVTEYRLTECSTDGKAGQESKMLQLDETYIEITLPVKQPKSPERWSCTVCQVEATSEHNLQQHFAGQRHRSNVASLESRNNGGRHQTTIRALQQEGSKSLAVNYGHLGPPSAWGKLPLNGSSSNSAVSSEMARHMMSLYFCKVCNMQCSNEFMFEEHRRGKKHRGKVWKLKVMTFCKVCNLQCNSEQMLANHLTGKKHQKNARLMGLI
ncbi:uncharacterized protein C2845_PM03G34870 [Panicum miliaceum]|uniref:C2H2-type domain-containing protein n=1 Tax=Panicum miliaceum TaxID=4540 RepID=A0A3L6T8W9_PANMI|nr:uncharacterized protein C2845_PM03G34870 [Panicum miliaceum]